MGDVIAGGTWRSSVILTDRRFLPCADGRAGGGSKATTGATTEEQIVHRVMVNGGYGTTMLVRAFHDARVRIMEQGVVISLARYYRYANHD